MRTIRPATDHDVATIAAATDKLREARDLLRHAGAPRAAKAVARAIKSAEGAHRHAGHRARRTALGDEAMRYSPTAHLAPATEVLDNAAHSEITP